MKAGFVAVIGRPSAGKSSLVNRLCGHKVSIVSPVPQTTRNRVRGILSTEEGQLVFLDTPGFHLSARRVNQALKRVALSSLDEVDLILYVIDVTREPGKEESMIAEAVSAAPQPVVVAENKIDLIDAAGDGVLPRAWSGFLSRLSKDAPAVGVSAATGSGLDGLIAALFEASAPGGPYYPEEYYTDQEPAFRISETIREQVMRRTVEELPHAVYVDVLDSRFEQAGEAERLNVRAVIYVERESQKGIVVGKGGSMISKIRRGAEGSLRELFPYPVSLDLRVKVHANWRKKESVLRRLLH